MVVVVVRTAASMVSPDHENPIGGDFLLALHGGNPEASDSLMSIYQSLRHRVSPNDRLSGRSLQMDFLTVEYTRKG